MSEEEGRSSKYKMGPDSEVSMESGQLGMIPEVNLMLGNHKACCDAKVGEFARFIHVITPERRICPEVKQAGAAHIDIEWLEPGALEAWMVRYVQKFITGPNGLILPGSTLIHCDAGIHRSTTLALACVMADPKYGFPDAIEMVLKAMRRYAKRYPPVWFAEEMKIVRKVTKEGRKKL